MQCICWIEKDSLCAGRDERLRYFLRYEAALADAGE